MILLFRSLQRKLKGNWKVLSNSGDSGITRESLAQVGRKTLPYVPLYVFVLKSLLRPRFSAPGIYIILYIYIIHFNTWSPGIQVQTVAHVELDFSDLAGTGVSNLHGTAVWLIRLL